MTQQPASFLALAANLDPPMREKVEQVYSPKGFGPVASSRHFVWIMSLALRGLHAEVISTQLLKEKGEKVPASAIRDYIIENVPPDLVGPHLQLEYLRRAKGLSEIDAMDVACKIVLARVMLLLDNGIPVDPEAQNDTVIKFVDLLRKLADTSFNMKLKTGAIAAAAEQVDVSVSVRQTTLLDLDGKKVEMDDRMAADLHHALHKLGVVRKKEIAPAAREEDEEAEVVGEAASTR